MPIIHFKNSVRSAMAEEIIAAIDAGTGAGTLKFYDGTQPASADDAVTDQVLLGTCTFSDPCATQSNGVITFNAITQDNAADADGTVTWARALDSDNNVVCDFDVTNLAGSGAIKMNTTTIVSGGPIAVNSLVVTVGS